MGHISLGPERTRTKRDALSLQVVKNGSCPAGTAELLTTWAAGCTVSCVGLLRTGPGMRVPAGPERLDSGTERRDIGRMVPVLLGAGAVIGVIVVIKALQSRGEHSPGPEEAPPPETIMDAGLPGGTG